MARPPSAPKEIRKVSPDDRPPATPTLTATRYTREYIPTSLSTQMETGEDAFPAGAVPRRSHGGRGVNLA